MDALYLQRMKEMLKDEYPSYLRCLEEESKKGMRINILKIDPSSFFDLTHFEAKPSPFADNGYYLQRSMTYGTTPAYYAGLFYMQEPSASSAVTVLDVQKGEKILDLCAAPGSKTTQIAEKLQNTGFLVANEINGTRARALVENVERCGAANVLILNNDTGTVASCFPEYFDRVLCDAPCSGEGMMRKNDIAFRQWSLENVEHCAQVQKEILHNAYLCLRKGGTLVYSTCTFSMEENENQIRDFLSTHPDMSVEHVQAPFGRKAFGLEGAIRIFPMDEGEGHFICRMRKAGEAEKKEFSSVSVKLPKLVQDFLDRTLEKPYPFYYVNGDKVYGGTFPFFRLPHGHILRDQVYLGEVKKNRFEPSHALFMSSYSRCRQSIPAGKEQIDAYVRGETLSFSCQKGWYALNYEGYSISGVYSDGRILKNKYPHYLRKR